MGASKSLRAIVVDDEMHARENLKMLLADYCEGVEVIAEAEDIEEAEKKINATQPDVAFLDIRMPSGSEGFELLKRIDTRRVLVVFVTAFKDYAISAFKANAIHYLLKPVDIEDLQAAVQKVKEQHSSLQHNGGGGRDYSESLTEVADALIQQKPTQRLTLYHSKGFKVLHQTDIVRLQAENNCTWLYLRDGSSYLDTRTLKFYEEILDKTRFFRTHKSHMVNLDDLSEYLHSDGPTAVLHSGAQVPIARARLGDFLSRMKG